jgi:hypothetical protein
MHRQIRQSRQQSWKVFVKGPFWFPNSLYLQWMQLGTQGAKEAPLPLLSSAVIYLCTLTELVTDDVCGLKAKQWRRLLISEIRLSRDAQMRAYGPAKSG